MMLQSGRRSALFARAPLRTILHFISIFALGVAVSACVLREATVEPNKVQAAAIPPPPPAAPQFDLTWLRGGGSSKLLTVSVISVGSGSCSVIACPNGTRIVDDCGTSSDDGMTDKAIAWLNYAIGADAGQGQPPLYVIASHGDRDHTNLIPKAIDPRTPIRGVFYGGDLTTFPRAFQTWTQQVRNSNAFMAIGTPASGNKEYDPSNQPNSKMVCSAGGMNEGLWVLAQNSGQTKNDKSIALRVARGALGVVIMGDAENGTESAIIQNYPKSPFLTNTALLVASHHGSDNGTNTQQWANAVAPKAVIFSAGQGFGNYGHPRCTSAEVYKNAKGLSAAADHALPCYQNPYNLQTFNWYGNQMAMFNTAESGAVVYRTNGISWQIWNCPDDDPSQCKLDVPKP